MIAEMSANEEIHTFSLVNQRIHFTVTPILLKRHGIMPRDHFLSVVDLAQFRGLQFLGRMLDFTPPSFMLVLLPVDDAQAESCSRLLLDFFASPAVHARPIATVFVMLCGTSQPSTWKTLLDSIVSANVHELRVQQDDKSAVVGSTKLKGAQEPFPLHHHHLKVFHAEAPFLFQPEIFPWTRCLINSSNLRQLDLQCQTDRPPSWSHILPHFTVPSLDTLDIEGRLTILSLSVFLDRHPGVRTLKIGSGSSHKATEFNPSDLAPCPPFVLHLHKLEAPVSYLVQLLGKTACSGKVCSLKTLTILPNLATTGFPFGAGIQHIFHEVADAEDLSWVTIQVPREVGVPPVSPWCKLTAPGDLLNPFAVVTKLEIHPSGAKKEWYRLQRCVLGECFFSIWAHTEFMFLQAAISCMMKNFPNIARLKVSEGKLDATQSGTAHRQTIIDHFRIAHPTLVHITVRSDDRQVDEWGSSE